jgi:hypothetical protein
MSGIDEILPWAIDNYPPENYGSFEEWSAAIEADFALFNRLPIDEILGEEMQTMEEYFTTRPDDVQLFLDQFT